MAVRGAIGKNKIIQEILEEFEGSFSPDGKEIRIPVEENGEIIQIKVALTAAKVNIDAPDSVPSTESLETILATESKGYQAELTAEEIAEVERLKNKMGF